MDSYYLSLLEGAGGVRRERLPGGLGQAQLAAGGSNQGGGVVRNMCETCGGGGEFSRGKSISYLTALLRNLGYGLAIVSLEAVFQFTWDTFVQENLHSSWPTSTALASSREAVAAS